MGSSRGALVALTVATVVVVVAWATLLVLGAVAANPSAQMFAAAAPTADPPAASSAADPSAPPSAVPPPAEAPDAAVEGLPQGAAVALTHLTVASPPPSPTQASPRSPAFTVSQVPGSGVAPGDKVIALSFDDGPDVRYTPQILAVLAQFGVTATFFMVGWEADAEPALVRQVVAGGNGVGNHTWSHVNLVKLKPSALPAQVDQTTQLLGSLTGRPVTCLRPPGGDINAAVETELAQRGLTPVLWNDDPRDWTRPGVAAIVRVALSEAKPGGIVELHDGGGNRSETVQALPAIITGLQARGYRFVPLCT